MYNLDGKIKHYNLNLNYFKTSNEVSETNYYVQQQLNYFISTYSSIVDTHVFILEYHDDIISATCYRMLKAFSGALGFKLLLCGRRRKTKSWVDKKQKSISWWRAKRLLKKDKAVFISAFNPLYKVNNSKEIFNSFDTNEWRPLEKFTPSQLGLIRIFYHIGYLKDDILESDVSQVFDARCRDANLEQYDFIEGFDTFPDNEVYYINITNDLERNQKVLNRMEDKEGLFFYHHKQNLSDKTIQQLKDFSYFIKNSSNAYGYNNDIDRKTIKDIAYRLNATIKEED